MLGRLSLGLIFENVCKEKGGSTARRIVKERFEMSRLTKVGVSKRNWVWFINDTVLISNLWVVNIVLVILYIVNIVIDINIVC